MNLRLTSSIAALGCALLASCYPVDESAANNKKPIAKQTATDKTIMSPEQQKIQDKRDAMKAAEKAKKKKERKESEVDTREDLPSKETSTNDNTESKPSEASDMPKPKDPKEIKEPKRPSYPVASKIPGKEGYVFSPYNNKQIDVRDMPSGQLVQDPTYTGNGKGYFRVP
jgi:hypothetical protein